MSSVSAVVVSSANFRRDRMVSESEPADCPETVTDQSDSDWFATMAQSLLGKDAGLHLSIITGFVERTCYRYASGDRKPPAYFLRALLRSDQGWTWLSAVMDGSTAAWWRDHQLALRKAKLFDQARRIMAEIGGRNV